MTVQNIHTGWVHVSGMLDATKSSCQRMCKRYLCKSKRLGRTSAGSVVGHSLANKDEIESPKRLFDFASMSQLLVDVPKTSATHHAHLINDNVRDTRPIAHELLVAFSFNTDVWAIEIATRRAGKEALVRAPANVVGGDTSRREHLAAFSQELLQCTHKNGLTRASSATDQGVKGRCWCLSLLCVVCGDDIVDEALSMIEGANVNADRRCLRCL